MSAAQYRLVGANGSVLEAGNGEVAVAGGILELQPASGSVLRVPPGRIASVAEPEPFTVLVTLADGSAHELSRLGRIRTQLLEELRDARAEGVAAETGAVGSAVRFTGTVAAAPADLHVFEDALLVVADGRVQRIAFSFVADTRVRDYTVYIDVVGQHTLVVTRLGRRTAEFAALGLGLGGVMAAGVMSGLDPGGGLGGYGLDGYGGHVGYGYGGPFGGEPGAYSALGGYWPR